MPDVMFYQSFSEKLLGGKIHLLDQCHEVQKLRKEVQRKPERRYTQSQTRDTVYKQPNEVGEKKSYRNLVHFDVTGDCSTS